jgi:UDP:flavonoid glycosyltransferase YjiC (YdhE family)
MAFPLIIDQFYWAYRVYKLGIGPKGANIGRISKEELRKRVLDLMTSQSYREKAALLGGLVRSENGIQAACERIEASLSSADQEEEGAAVNE